jgi:hypothetical protein
MKRSFSIFAIMLMLAFMSMTTGCAGFRASGAVSPWMFLLPGLGQNQPTPPASIPAVPVADEPLVAAN